MDGKERYVFSAGIAAKDMTGDIKAKFVQGDGTEGKEYTTSIKWYCDKLITNADGIYSDEAVALAKALENYGGYTQIHFNHNTDDLANAGRDYPLPEVDPASIADPVKSGKCTGAAYIGTSTLLKTTVGMKHYFTLDGDAADYTFTVNGEELTAESDSKGTYVLIDDIWARNLGEPIELTVSNEADGTAFSLSYSIYNYVKQVLASSTMDEATKNMVRGLYGYGEAAKAYLASVN